jgi:hypothetical protein
MVIFQFHNPDILIRVAKPELVKKRLAGVEYTEFARKRSNHSILPTWVQPLPVIRPGGVWWVRFQNLETSCAILILELLRHRRFVLQAVVGLRSRLLLRSY